MTVVETRLPEQDRPVATMAGHWILAKLGKKVLRPGGRAFTRRLLDTSGVAGSDVDGGVDVDDVAVAHVAHHDLHARKRDRKLLDRPGQSEDRMAGMDQNREPSTLEKQIHERVYRRVVGVIAVD